MAPEHVKKIENLANSMADVIGALKELTMVLFDLGLDDSSRELADILDKTRKAHGRLLTEVKKLQDLNK